MTSANLPKPQTAMADGIHALMPLERMSLGARKLRDIYNRKVGASLYQREFYIWPETIERWQAKEGMPRDIPIEKLFGFDPPGNYGLGQLGWCEAALVPAFETKILEDRGDHELVQDHAGRKLLCFKGKRHGFMPEYVDHPVKDMKTWKEEIEWRMDPDAPARYADLGKRMVEAKAA